MAKEHEEFARVAKQFGWKTPDGKEVTPEFVETSMTAEPEPEAAQFSQQQLAALDYAEKTIVDSYKRRIEDACNSGKFSPAYAKEKLEPMLETLQFSFGDDGKPEPTPLDQVLDALESIPDGSMLTGTSPTTHRKSAGVNLFGVQRFSLDGMREETPDEDPEESPDFVTEEQAHAIAGAVLESANIPHH